MPTAAESPRGFYCVQCGEALPKGIDYPYICRACRQYYLDNKQMPPRSDDYRKEEHELRLEHLTALLRGRKAPVGRGLFVKLPLYQNHYPNLDAIRKSLEKIIGERQQKRDRRKKKRQGD